MGHLEAAASPILRPLILGEQAVVDEAEAGVVATWTHKTALVAMLVSSAEDRAKGYGLPASEYRAVYEAHKSMRPLNASQFWIGQYVGPGLAHEQVTPLVVVGERLEDPPRPHAYLMTIVVGQLVLQGVRFTTPALEVRLGTRRDLPRLWPRTAAVVWPAGVAVDQAAMPAFCGGHELLVEDVPLRIEPWRRATDLPESRLVGATVELDALCGKHVIYYPATLARWGIGGVFHAFVTSCECGVGYLIETRSDGAHITADTITNGRQAVESRYDALPGAEVEIRNPAGVFVAKRLGSV
jgi:hypothetical protein